MVERSSIQFNIWRNTRSMVLYGWSDAPTDIAPVVHRATWNRVFSVADDILMPLVRASHIIVIKDVNHS